MAHVCPWWIGFLLVNPLRKLMQNPEKILGPFIKEGMTILEVGPGMGYFSITLARMAGARGRVICVDMQERMLRSLKKRAAKAGYSDKIETRLCRADSLGIDDLKGAVDFVMLFAVVHEVQDRQGMFQQIWDCLKKGGMVLFSEPSGHESADGFNASLSMARSCGFATVEEPRIWRSRSAVLIKK